MAEVGLAAERVIPRRHGAPSSLNRVRLARINRPRLVAPLLALAITLANLSWVIRDHTTPSWDQSHYLYLTRIYRHDLGRYGLSRMFHDIHTIDPGRGQGLSLLMIPIGYFTDDGPTTGLILNLILWPMFLLSTGAIAAHFYGEKARLLAMIIVAPMPLIVALGDTVLQDFLLVSLTSIGVWALLRTKNYTRLWASAGLGVVIMLGSLTKISFGLTLAIPMLLVFASRLVELRELRSRKEPTKPAIRQTLLCLAVLAITSGLLTIFWYANTWAATRAYLHAAFMKQPGTIDNPTSFQHVGEFSLAMANEAFSWQLTIVALLTLVLAVLGIRSLRLTIDLPRLYRIAFLGSFAWVPFLAVVVSTNHGTRYAVATLPAFAIVVAGRITMLRWRWARYGVVALTVVAAVSMTLQVDSSRWRFPFLANQYTISTRFGPAGIQLARGLGPASNFTARDYASDMLDYLESISKNTQGVVQPKTVAILELQGYVNGNTMPYEASLRGLPFTFETLLSDGSPPQQATVMTQLKAADIALFLSQPAAERQAELGRVAQLNDTAAAHHMTPAMFALFKPNPGSVYVGADSGQGDQMYAFLRKH